MTENDGFEQFANASKTREEKRNFGRWHHERAQKTGKRLNAWYWIASACAVVLITSLYIQGYIFSLLITELKHAFDLLGIDTHNLEQDDVIAILYFSKISTTALILLFSVWVLRRISKLQKLRSIHSDKAVIANTIQSILDSGHAKEMKPTLDKATEGLLASSCEPYKQHKKDNSTLAKQCAELVESIGALLKNKEDH